MADLTEEEAVEILEAIARDESATGASRISAIRQLREMGRLGEVEERGEFADLDELAPRRGRG
jgi:hypothetical protein